MRDDDDDDEYCPVCSRRKRHRREDSGALEAVGVQTVGVIRPIKKPKFWR